MLSRGVKIIIVVILSLAIIGILVYFFVTRLNLTPESKTETPANSTQTVVEEKEITITPPEITEAEMTATQVKNLALMFTERFGTFSNTNDFAVLDDLQVMMTKSFASWFNTTYKKKLQAEYNGDTAYMNVTTEALAVNFEKQTDKSAAVMVTARRVKEVAGGEPQTFSQKLKLEFVKDNGDWLVNSAYWQN